MIINSIINLLTNEIESRCWSNKSLSILLILIVLSFGASSLFIDYNNIIEQLISFSIICTFLIISIFIINLKIEYSSFGLLKTNTRYLLWIPIIYLIILILFTLILPIWELILTKFLGIEIEPQEILLELNNIDNPLHLSLFIFTSVIIAPVYEELLFRGIVLPKLLNRFSHIKSIIISSMIFSILHFHFPALLPLFILSVVLSYLYLITGSLWSSIFLHALFNGVTVAIFLSIN